MELFEVTQSKSVVKPLEILNLDHTGYTYNMRKEQFNDLDRLKVGYYSGLFDEEPCCILKTPTFLVSDAAKHLLELYDSDIQWKAIQLFPLHKACTDAPLYWVPLFLELDCLHPDTQKYTSGTVGKIVLSEKRCVGHPIFKVSGILECKIVISLAVAESLMRRRLYGIGLKKLEVK